MTFRTRSRSLAMLLVLGCTAAGPTTAPTTQADRIGGWLKDVASAEPAVRDLARVNLLGLAQDDLPDLRRAAEAAAPLRPTQIEAIRETFVYIHTRAAMLKLPTMGNAYIGVNLMLNSWGWIAGAQLPNEPMGVRVLGRIPGSAGERFLENGDVIQGFEFGEQTVWFAAPDDLVRVVGQLQAGVPISMRVLRAGRSLTLTFPLDPRPYPEGSSNPADAADRTAEAASQAVDEAIASLHQEFSGLVD